MHGAYGQGLQSTAHRQQGRLQDVDRIDLRRQRHAQAVGKGVLANHERQFPAARRTQALGIPQPHDRPIRIENDCGRHDRPRQWAPSGLIHAGQ